MPSLYIGEQPVRTVALASNNDDATAVAADVMKDKIAYNQYGKIVGTAEPAEDLDSEMTAQDSLIEQIKSAVASKASVSYPTLSNPASAGNIESGYQAIGQDGSVIEGSMVGAVTVTATFNGTNGKSITVNGLSKYKNFMMVSIPTSGHSLGSYVIYGVRMVDGVLTGNYYSSSKLYKFTGDSSGISINGDEITISSGSIGNLMFATADSLEFVLWN